MSLTQAQAAAITHIEADAVRRQEKARGEIEEVRTMCNIGQSDIEKVLQLITTQARVVVHFHPDRLNARGQRVVEGLLASGLYQNQFETGLSNGKLSPYPGGDRDRWENTLFRGAYATATSSERPKYGALDLMRHPDGASPRFGSCYLVLHPPVSRRCTFTYMDSHRLPLEKGTLAVFEDVLAALLSECFERWYALGEKHIRPPGLISCLLQNLPGQYPDPSLLTPVRNLNHYIEAQIHGLLLLERDVERLVADPSFQGEETGELLEALCEKYDIEICWHCGFRMKAADVPADFRGPAMPSLAQRIARKGYIDASVLGQAAADLRRNPRQWLDRGTLEQCLQELKLLWHVLVGFGNPVW
jgi:hypothetical protein